MQNYNVVLCWGCEVSARDEHEAEEMARDLFDSEMILVGDMTASIEKAENDEEE